METADGPDGGVNAHQRAKALKINKGKNKGMISDQEVDNHTA
jgi:hypothetical protein